MHKYYNKNVPLWEALSEVHWTSQFYDIPRFVKKPDSLPEIDKTLLGDIQGKTILHSQCHLGMESISMSKLGANVTGIDFSKKAIAYADQLNQKTYSEVRFIHENIYNLKKYDLKNRFDIVYSSYGVIPWLYDLDKWAEIIQYCLKPQGRFVLIEFHPMIFNLDSEGKIIASYGSNSSPEKYLMSKSYSGDALPQTYSEYNWNHSLSQILTSLNKYLDMIHFEEYAYSSYPCFDDVEKISKWKYQMKIFQNISFPHMFSTIFAYN